MWIRHALLVLAALAGAAVASWLGERDPPVFVPDKAFDQMNYVHMLLPPEAAVRHVGEWICKKGGAGCENDLAAVKSAYNEANPRYNAMLNAYHKDKAGFEPLYEEALASAERFAAVWATFVKNNTSKSAAVE